MSMNVNVCAASIPTIEQRIDRPPLRSAAGGWWHRSSAQSGVACAIGIAYQAHRGRPTSVAELATVEADRADVALVLTENGSVESADDAVIRCRVESFLGLPIAAPTGSFVPPIAGIRPTRLGSVGGVARSASVGAAVAAKAQLGAGKDRAPAAASGGSTGTAR